MDKLVIVPTYNERENIDPLLERLLALPHGLEVLVVDDGSPDGTAALVEAWRTRSPRVHLIRRPGKLGLGSAYRDGFRYALQHGAEYVFEMDADFSHDPEHLSEMAAAAADADLVLGSRYIDGVRVVNWPLHRIMLSSFANRYVRAITGLDVTDCTTGFRCWRRDALARLPLKGLISDGYAFLVEQLYLAQRAGCRIREVPIIFVERREGASKLSSSVLIESAIVPWRLRLKS